MTQQEALDLALVPVAVGSQVHLPELAAGSSSCSTAPKAVPASVK